MGYLFPTVEERTNDIRRRPPHNLHFFTQTGNDGAYAQVCTIAPSIPEFDSLACA